MTNSCEELPQTTPYQNLSRHLKRLHLSHMLTHWESVEQQAMQEGWSYAQFLLALCELEAQRRWNVRPQGVTTKLESRLDQGNGIETSLKKGTFLRLECHQLGRQS